MADVPKKGAKSEQSEEWYQQAPLHFHHYAETTAKQKSSSWTLTLRKEVKEEKEASREVRPVLPRGSVVRV